MRKTFLMLGWGLAALFASSNAHSQCDRPPIGTPYTCYFTNGTKVVVPDGGGGAPSNSTGTAILYVVGYNDNPCEILLSPELFASSGSGQLGKVNCLLATGSPVSRITGPDATNIYPAQLELNLKLRASVSSLGDQTFYSDSSLTLRGNGIRSLPFKGQQLTQDKPVHFSNPKDPNSKGFTLDKVSVVLNQ